MAGINFQVGQAHKKAQPFLGLHSGLLVASCDALWQWRGIRDKDLQKVMESAGAWQRRQLQAATAGLSASHTLRPTALRHLTWAGTRSRAACGRCAGGSCKDLLPVGPAVILTPAMDPSCASPRPSRLKPCLVIAPVPATGLLCACGRNRLPGGCCRQGAVPGEQEGWVATAASPAAALRPLLPPRSPPSTWFTACRA